MMTHGINKRKPKPSAIPTLHINAILLYTSDENSLVNKYFNVSNAQIKVLKNNAGTEVFTVSHFNKSTGHHKLVVNNNTKSEEKVIDFNALIEQAQYWENNSVALQSKLDKMIIEMDPVKQQNNYMIKENKQLTKHLLQLKQHSLIII